MTIEQFYTEKRIPTHLQRHMFLVAALGLHLAQHWRDEEVNADEVVTVLLLHDLGNLLKFELEKGVEIFDEPERDLAYWQQVNEEMKTQYGSDVQEATLKMARELEVGERILFLLAHMYISKLPEDVVNTDPAQAICAYSDYRVAPSGYVSLAERLEDLRLRYAHRESKWADAQKIEKKTELATQLEQQIQDKISTDVQNLPVAELTELAQQLREWKIKLT